MLKNINSAFLSSLVVLFVFFGLACLHVFLGQDQRQVSLSILGCAGVMAGSALGNSQWRANQLERRIRELELQLMVKKELDKRSV